MGLELVRDKEKTKQLIEKYRSLPELDIERATKELFTPTLPRKQKRKIIKVIKDFDETETKIETIIEIDARTGEEIVNQQIWTNKVECSLCGRLASRKNLLKCNMCGRELEICQACLDEAYNKKLVYDYSEWVCQKCGKPERIIWGLSGYCSCWFPKITKVRHKIVCPSCYSRLP